MLRWTRNLVWLLGLGTLAAMAFFAAMAILLVFDLPPATTHVARSALPGHTAALKPLMIAMLLIGIGTGLAVDHIFRRLIAIIDTVIEGQPFTPRNGGRLRAIAWALLAIQLLDLGFAAVVHGINLHIRHAPFGWSPSATGWIAVLLLFALAQVFAKGAAMQEDLEGTV